MKDLYNEKYQTMMKETEDDTKKWKDILCLWIGRININQVKMHILPKMIHRVDSIPIKILMTFFTELGKTLMKSIWNHGDPK